MPLIDPCLLGSEKYHKCKDHFTRLLYIHLHLISAPWGRGDGEPFSIKVRAVPLFSETVADVEEALQNLNDIGLIVLYEVDGKQYFQITQYEEHHQYRAAQRGKKSRIPGPEQQQSTTPEQRKDMALNGLKKCQELLKGKAASSDG